MYSAKLLVSAIASTGSAVYLLSKSKLYAESDIHVEEPAAPSIVSRIAVIGSGIGGSSAVHFLRFVILLFFLSLEYFNKTSFLHTHFEN